MNIKEIDSLLLQEMEVVRGGLTEGTCQCKEGAALGNDGNGSCSCNSQAKLAEFTTPKEESRCTCEKGAAQ